VTTVGLLTTFVCGGYVLADWARLNAAYVRFQNLSSTGADLSALFTGLERHGVLHHRSR